MAYSAQDIIQSAFRVAGITGKKEAPSADEMQDGLQALNFLVDNWSAKRLLQSALVRESFPLVSGKQSYTIGPGMNFNTACPLSIDWAFYTDGFGIKRGLDIITREQFDSLEDSQIVSAPPTALFFDPGATQQVSQSGTIFLYFTPDGSTSYTLTIESQKPFTEFATLTTAFTFPPSYLRAFKWNLALELADEYGRPVTDTMHENAVDSLETLEALNSAPVMCLIDVPGTKGGGFNWISGDSN